MLASISSEFKQSHQASWLGTSCVRNRLYNLLCWIGIRYLLATCTFTPLYGRLCEIMGRKNANHMALFFAASGILLCGFSRSMEMLILSRFVSYLYVLSISPDALPAFRNWWRGTNNDFFVCLCLFNLKSYLYKLEPHRIIVSDMHSLRVTSFHFPPWLLLITRIRIEV